MIRPGHAGGSRSNDFLLRRGKSERVDRNVTRRASDVEEEIDVTARKRAENLAYS